MTDPLIPPLTEPVRLESVHHCEKRPDRTGIAWDPAIGGWFAEAGSPHPTGAMFATCPWCGGKLQKLALASAHVVAAAGALKGGPK